jgi:hypothetical protein
MIAYHPAGVSAQAFDDVKSPALLAVPAGFAQRAFTQFRISCRSNLRTAATAAVLGFINDVVKAPAAYLVILADIFEIGIGPGEFDPVRIAAKACGII